VRPPRTVAPKRPSTRVGAQRVRSTIGLLRLVADDVRKGVLGDRVGRVSQRVWTGAFFPSMLTDSRFVDQEFPILIQREGARLTSGKSGTISATRHAKRARTRKIPDSFPCQREFAGAQTGSSGLRPPPAIPAEFATRLAPLKAGVTSVGYKPAQKMSGPGDRKLTHLLPPLASSSLPAETIFRLSGIQRQQRLVSPASETGSSPALRLFRAASNSIGKSGRPRSELQDNYRRSGAQAAGGAVEVCRRRRRRRRGRDESRLTEDPQRLLKSPGPR